jgi:site-specific DNA-cytosine methylase
MKVLIACESSGIVREAFRAMGHNAISCDTQPADDGSPHHAQNDVRNILDMGWDLMIAHPPCTYLSVSGMHWTTRGLRDPQLTEDALEFVQLLMNAPIEYIAIENPVGVISTRIRKPDQIIQPYQFGDNASKKTCLWLKGLPKLKPTKIIEGRTVVIPNGKVAQRWDNQTDSGQNKLGPSDTRWKERSKTYPGIAAAMAQQWNNPSMTTLF